MKIEETFNMDEFLSPGNHEVFYKSENMKVVRWSGFDDWQITDLSNALATGKTCIEYSLKSDRGGHGDLLVTNFVFSKFGNDLKALWNFCEALEIAGYNSVEVEGIKIYKGEVKGIRKFSPFNLDKIKPLKKIPKKWTLRHVYSTLVNKQFKDLKCTGVYTDDYAWDDACDYRRGEISSAIEFIKGILEHPSGWRVWDHGDSIGVCCHSFDNNKFVPVV